MLCLFTLVSLYHVRTARANKALSAYIRTHVSRVATRTLTQLQEEVGTHHVKYFRLIRNC